MTHEIPLHPLCTLFPRLGAAELAVLRDDIAAQGQREPIVVHEGQILDGGNRYRACLDAGIEPRIVAFSGTDPIAFVLSANLHRRHLTAGQQAAIVARAQDWSKAHRHGGDRRSEQAATLPLDTVAARAAQSGASDRTQRMADAVARRAPALAEKVAHGEISLPAAHRQATAGAPRPRKRDAGTSPEVAAPPKAGAPEPASLPAPAAAKPTPPELVRASESLDAPADDLTEVERLRDLADDLTAQLAGFEKAMQGEAAAAAEIASLTRRLRTVESQRDVHMATAAELSQENKRLKRANATLRKALDAARSAPSEAAA